jgi:hypothetical protein
MEIKSREQRRQSAEKHSPHFCTLKKKQMVVLLPHIMGGGGVVLFGI